jgi:hypothetical protein
VYIARGVWTLNRDQLNQYPIPNRSRIAKAAPSWVGRLSNGAFYSVRV